MHFCVENTAVFSQNPLYFSSAFGSNLSRCISTECVRLTISNTAAFTAVFFFGLTPRFSSEHETLGYTVLSERIESYKALKLQKKTVVLLFLLHAVFGCIQSLITASPSISGDDDVTL